MTVPVDAISSTVVNLLEALLTRILAGNAQKWAEQILQTVKEKLSKKPSGEEAIEDFEKLPNDEDFQASLRIQLRKALQTDQAFRQGLQDLIAEINSKSDGRGLWQQYAGNDAKQFGYITDSKFIIEESQAKAEAKVEKFAKVKGDVKAIVYYSPDKNINMDKGGASNGDATEK